MKKVLVTLLILTILFSIFPLNLIVHAATDDYIDIYWGMYGDQYKLYKKPEAGFSLSSGGQTVVADSGGELNIKLGDTISISNLSKASRTNSLNGYDWQVYGNTSVGGVTVALGVLSNLPSSIKLQYTGTYDFYLCVRDNQPNMPTGAEGAWENWSDNGLHRYYGTSSTGVKMWWYFVKVTVNVTSDKPVADMTFSDTSSSTKNIYLGESFTLEDKSYAITDGASIIGWNVKAGSSSATYIGNPNEFFKTYTPMGIGTFKYILNYVHDSNSAKSENPAKTLTVIVSQKPQPGQGKVIYEYYKDSIKPENLQGTNEVGISNPYVVVLPDSYGENLKFSSATYSGEAVTAGGSCKNGDSIAITDTTKDLTIQAIFVKDSASGGGRPPSAYVYAPTPVMAGDEIDVNANGSYAQDGKSIKSYLWDLKNANITSGFTGNKGKLWYKYDGREEIKLTVVDSEGMTDTTSTDVEVLPPTPTAIIAHSGTLKENRLVTLSSLSSKHPKHYQIDKTKTKWEITPVSSGLIIDDIKYNGALLGSATKDVLFKKSGKYKIKLTVYITIDYDGWQTEYSDTTEEIIEIQQDLPPIANFSIPSRHLRNPEDSNKVVLQLTDNSRSDDGDIITKRLWKMAYDTNNNGDFTDEEWTVIDNGNNTSPTIEVYDVGKYKFELEIEEDYGQPTIYEFISVSDKKTANTIYKNNNEKIAEIINTAPIVDFEVKMKKPVDMIILTDYEGQKLADLESSLTALKTEINALNLDFKYSIVKNKINIGVVNDAKRKFYRYARYNHVYDILLMQSNGTREIFGSPASELYKWEETTGLESEEIKLPSRNPQNITWSKSANYYYETSTHAQQRFNLSISCTNDVKTNYDTYYTAESVSKSLGLGYAKYNFKNENVTIDKKFNKGEILQEIVANLNAVDVDKITTIPLRDNSEKYLVMAINDYYSLGNLTESIKNYVINNNFKIKSVMNEAIRDMLVTSEKIYDIKSVYGETYYYLKNGKILRTGNELSSPGILYPVDVTEQLSDVINIEIIPEAQAALYFKSNGQVFIQYASEKVISEFPISNIKQHKIFSFNYNNGTWYFLTNDNVLYRYNLYDKSVSKINTGSYVVDKILDAQRVYLTTNGKVIFESGYYNNPFQDGGSGSGWSELKYLDNTTVANIKELTPAMTKKGDSINSNRILKNDGTVVNAKNEVILSNVKNMTYVKNAVFYEMNDGSYKIEAATFSHTTIEGPKGEKYVVNNYMLSPITNLAMRDIKEIYKFIYKTLGSYNYYTGWTYTLEYRYYILCNNGSLYSYSWEPRNPTYTDQSFPYVSILPTKTIETNVSQMGAGITKNRIESTAEPQKLIPYYLYKDGTVKKNTSLIPGLTNVNKLAIPYIIEPVVNDETTIIALFKDGTVKGMGRSSNGELGQFNANIGTFVNPLNNRVVLNDYNKPYVKPNDLVGLSIFNKSYLQDQYQNAIDDVLNEIKAESSTGTQYILLGENISYESYFSDYENDPKQKQVWRYDHDANYFENGLGLASYSGKEITAPIETFEKVGRFKVTLKARDNPKDVDIFDNYRLWNKNDSNMLIYVHRKPIAQMNVNVITNADNTFSITVDDGGSYDLDHISLSNKGIAQWDWRWKEANEYDWHHEKININNGTIAKTYIIMLRVKDIEGAWSDPIYQTVDASIPYPPIAKFELTKASIAPTELAQIKDTSYAIMSNLTNWHWIVKRINADGSIGTTLQEVSATSSNAGTGGYDTNLNITKTNPGIGKYRIYLRVKADNGLWSDGGTDAAPNSNLIPNGDAEQREASGIPTDWNTWASAPDKVTFTSRTTADWKISGNASFEIITQPNSNYAGVYFKDVPGIAGHSYSFTGKIGAHRCQGYFYINAMDSSNNVLGTYVSNVVTSPVVKNVSINFTAPANTKTLRVHIVNGNTTEYVQGYSEHVFADDLVLYDNDATNNMFYRDLTINQALKIDDVSIQGRWNHFRGWTDKFGIWKDVMKDTTYTDEKGVNRYPYRFLSYEMIDIKIKLEGYADEVTIDFPVNTGSGYSLGSMNYRDKLGHEYSYQEDLGYTVNFPYKGPFKNPLNPAQKDPTIEWSYILPLVHSSASWENVRLYQPYEISITAKKGSYEVTQIKKIDITGNVDDLIFIQPVAR